jgi:hypothetical protein
MAEKNDNIPITSLIRYIPQGASDYTIEFYNVINIENKFYIPTRIWGQQREKTTFNFWIVISARQRQQQMIQFTSIRLLETLKADNKSGQVLLDISKLRL